MSDAASVAMPEGFAIVNSPLGIVLVALMDCAPVPVRVMLAVPPADPLIVRVFPTSYDPLNETLVLSTVKDPIADRRSPDATVYVCVTPPAVPEESVKLFTVSDPGRSIVYVGKPDKLLVNVSEPFVCVYVVPEETEKSVDVVACVST